jgi:hypothetical protein
MNHSILSGFVGQEGGSEGQLFKYIQEKENNIILLSKQEQGMIRIICFVVSANKWQIKEVLFHQKNKTGAHTGGPLIFICSENLLSVRTNVCYLPSSFRI